ncbi:GNAT family N-acetyltransferase [Pontibacter harenae]|uniref:GNAT family N-acetyltransferase n=1 Tax=Pontibacter harenae TaxID=2894083 RepID=UPI001E3CD6BB|nr:GNAT family N-acetyltransferase [Pontibacter harenae]MCC9165902.1 GNAT family N-acetyltransferase [Pontibacter harenae]
MFLSSDKIYLRALEPADLNFLYSLENDASVWHFGNSLTPYSKHVLEQYLQNASLDIYTVKQLRLIICTQNHQAIGAIDLYDYDPLHRRAAVGIVVAADWRGKGYAAEALELLQEYCQQILHLHQVYCSVSTDNPQSIKLFSKAGFEQVGVRKQWLLSADGWTDVIEFQKLF